MYLEKKDIVTVVLLTIFTCGIYSWIWMAGVANAIRDQKRDVSAPSGGMVVLLTIVTCGIYGIFFFYKLGDDLRTFPPKGGDSDGVIYLVLYLLTASVVAIAIAQDRINKIVDYHASGKKDDPEVVG